MPKRIVPGEFSFDRVAKEKLRCKVKAQKTRDKRRASGLCPHCGNPSPSGDCEDCKKDRREKRNERIRNGLCSTCNKLNGNGKTQCDECSSKESVKDKERRKAPGGYRKQKSALLKYLYGITIDEYEELLAWQNYTCEICQRPHNPKGRRMFVDHDHETGALRGLLCQNCNSVLGLAHDSPEVLRKAADYIEKYKKET